jgi:hypothetical protein
MRHLILTLLLTTTALGAAPAQDVVNRELENVSAFARLYGVTRYFYPSDTAARLDWDAFAVQGVREVRQAPDRRTLQAQLETLFAPLGPGIQIGESLTAAPGKGQPDKTLIAWRYFGAAVATPAGPYRAKRTNRALEAAGTTPATTAELFDDVPPISGAHVDVDLGSGLKARVPLALSEADANAKGPALDALQAALPKNGGTGAEVDLDTRLAGVVVAWNVFRHFYPYWTEAGVDWDTRLRPNLELAHRAGNRQAQRDALRQLVADVRDGHGVVGDPTRTGRAGLALRFGVVENQVVVTASGDPSRVPVGAVVRALNNVPAMKRVADAMALASGTTQWKRSRALQEIAACDKGDQVGLSLDSGDGTQLVTLPCEAAQPTPESRPAPITEWNPGIYYVDLTRATMAEITPRLDQLAKAEGIVFDLRGYPTDAGAQILRHLVDAPESDRWMHIAKIVWPFGQIAGWQSVGWNVAPRAPRLGGKIVFMTDGRAISYAESVMGYVKDRKLGTIVGGTTAGANGNVVRFPVPGGFTIGFTGMRVTGHDGTTPFHLVGVQPDIPAEPTIDGVRRGRDEVLDRALAVIGKGLGDQ